MRTRRYRLLLVLSHPVQYVAPLLRRMAIHPQLEIQVVYASLRGAEQGHDTGFGRDVVWDIPLLDGYDWAVLKGVQRPQRSTPLATCASINKLMRTGSFDVVYAGGYYFREAWGTMFAARRNQLPLLLSTDAHSLESWRVQSPLRRQLKRMLLKKLYGSAAGVLAGSTGTVEFLASLGVSRERIHLAGNMVDNDWWLAQAARTNRTDQRRSWAIPLEAPVLLFCGKLQLWKRPGDLLEAFARTGAEKGYLVFAGDGPLAPQLRKAAETLGIGARVRWLGFVNQSQLPAIYTACDVLVLPSSYEPFGLVVNEAMLCGSGAIVSDRVGAKFDLVQQDGTGFVYPCGDIGALAGLLQQLLASPETIHRLGAAARERMHSWRPEQNVEAFVEAAIQAASRTP